MSIKKGRKLITCLRRGGYEGLSFIHGNQVAPESRGKEYRIVSIKETTTELERIRGRTPLTHIEYMDGRKGEIGLFYILKDREAL